MWCGKNSVVDTDDADALVTNLEYGKTAYVNGQKLTGTLNVYNDSLMGFTVDTYVQQHNASNSLDVWGKRIFNEDKIIRPATMYNNTLWGMINISYSDIATAQNITADKVLNGYTIYGVAGSIIKSNEEVDVIVDPSTTTQIINPNAGYTGLANITINGVTANIDNNIISDNIKNRSYYP